MIDGRPVVLALFLGAGCSSVPSESVHPEAQDFRKEQPERATTTATAIYALERMDPYDSATRGSAPHSYEIRSHECASGRIAMRLLLRTDLTNRILKEPDRFRLAIADRASDAAPPQAQMYLHLLGEWGDEESLRRVKILALEGSDPTVKDFALIVLSARGARTDRDWFSDRLREQERSGLARAWARYAVDGGAASKAVLRESSRMLAATDDDPSARWVRILLLAQIARLRDREMVYALAHSLTHEDTLVRHAAFFLLSSLVAQCPPLEDGHRYLDAPKATEVLHRRMFEWFAEVGPRLAWDAATGLFRSNGKK